MDEPPAAGVREQLREDLQSMLRDRGDEFLKGDDYVDRWGYTIDETGTVPYHFKYGVSS